MEWTQRPAAQKLTPRQREVLRLIERGHTNSEIAEKLGISLQGAKWHVRELLNKFDVENRDDLVAASKANHSLGEAARRLLSMGPVALPKISLGSVFGGLAVATSIGVAAIAIAVGTSPGRGAPESDPLHTKARVFELAPALTPAPMPSVTGAIWTPQQALDRARQEAGAEIGVGSYDHNLAGRIDLTTFTVTRFEWQPGVSHFELPDGDNYWQDTIPRNLWVVHWESPSVATRTGSPPVVRVMVDALVEDGARDKSLKALLVTALGPSGEFAGIGGGTFSNYSREAHSRDAMEANGPTTYVAWENGVVGGPRLGVYPTRAGHWCLVEPQSSTCGFSPERPPLPVIFSVGSSFNPATGVGRTWVTVQAEQRVDHIRVLPGDGRDLEYQLFDPPPEVPAGSRFAYLELGPSLPADKITVIGYDATVNELGRRTGPGLVPPVGANGSVGP